MKRIIVTGANGQLGKCIQKAAKKYPNLEFFFRTSSQLDITKTDDITAAFEAVDPDYCINCAAYTNVEQAEKTPEISFKVNAEAAKSLAFACLTHKVILIHISTDYVFDGEKKEPYTVHDTTNPINEYGKSKLQGEKYIQEILEDYYIIRTSWLYSEFGTNFYKTILKKAKVERTLYITNQQKGCPTNANNLAKYIIDKVLLEDTKTGIYHFTDGEAMTWYDFACKILKDKGLHEKVKLIKDENYLSFAKRPKQSILIN